MVQPRATIPVRWSSLCNQTVNKQNNNHNCYCTNRIGKRPQEGTNTRNIRTTAVIAISYCVQYYYYSFYSVFSFPLLHHQYHPFRTTTTTTISKRQQYHTTTTTKWIGWNNCILPNNVMTQQKMKYNTDIRSSSSSLEQSTTTTSTSSHKLITLPIVGGDYVGIESSFDPTKSYPLLPLINDKMNDGEDKTAVAIQTCDMIPLPDYLIPAVLFEWDQAPSCLETIVSEDDENDSTATTQPLTKSDSSYTDSALLNQKIKTQQQHQQQLEVEQPCSLNLFRRNSITIYPAVGCSIDNLDTKKSLQTFSSNAISRGKSPAIQVVKPPPTSSSTSFVTNDVEEIVDQSKLRVVPQFAQQIVSSSTSSNRNGSTTPSTKWTVETILGWIRDENHRVRITVNIDRSTTTGAETCYVMKLMKPVVITFEKQISTASTAGTLADGGGLTGRTISQYMGPYLRSQYSFAQQKQQQRHIPPPPSFHTDITSLVILEQFALPGNVTIALHQLIKSGDSNNRKDNQEESFVLDVGYFQEIQEDANNYNTMTTSENKNDQDTTAVYRHYHTIVRRKFQTSTAPFLDDSSKNNNNHVDNDDDSPLQILTYLY